MDRSFTSRPDITVAAAQASPVLFDRSATLDKVAAEVRSVGASGADLIVFPESFVPTYPDFVWRLKPWAGQEWMRLFTEQSVNIDTDLDPVKQAAAVSGVWVALGITERSTTGSLFNTVVHINEGGELAAIHRKLVPTGAERLVWGNGQDSVLSVVEVKGARVGTLICWENYMPLARAAMYEAGIDILLSPTWDNSDVWVPTLRHIAKEGRVFVVGVTPYINGSMVPRDIPGADDIYGGPEDLMSAGNTAIVDPDGNLVAGPVTGREETLQATLDLNQITTARAQFDSAGHYSRPDVISLNVTVSSRAPTRGSTSDTDSAEQGDPAGKAEDS